jgi:putative tricarboxylic transport membrane protein
MDGRERTSSAGIAIGLGLILVAAVVGYDAAGMHVPPVHARVGPKVFPYLIACGLAAAGASIVWQAARRGGFAEASSDTDWPAVAIVAAGLIVHMNILKPLGFVPAAIVLFMAVAAAFGSRRFLRDGAVAVLLAVATYFGFTQLLGLQLPAGVVAGI